MSLSISFTVLMDKVWAAWQGCDNEGCWRQYVRVWSVVCAAVFLFGGATLFLRPTPASSAPASRADDEDEDVETATEHTASHARATSTGTNHSVRLHDCVHFRRPRADCSHTPLSPTNFPRCRSHSSFPSRVRDPPMLPCPCANPLAFSSTCLAFSTPIHNPPAPRSGA